MKSAQITILPYFMRLGYCVHAKKDDILSVFGAAWLNVQIYRISYKGIRK